jgi:hypothetical protein
MSDGAALSADGPAEFGVAGIEVPFGGGARAFHNRA